MIRTYGRMNDAWTPEFQEKLENQPEPAKEEHESRGISFHGRHKGFLGVFQAIMARKSGKPQR
jgi:hypothetical protein